MFAQVVFHGDAPPPEGAQPAPLLPARPPAAEHKAARTRKAPCMDGFACQARGVRASVRAEAADCRA
jgi:hypothetical protein